MNSTLTAAEVVRHAAPIAALLGVGELRYLTSSKYGAVMNDEWSLSPDQAAALLLGLIVARITYITVAPALVECHTPETHGMTYVRTNDKTPESILRARFIAACSALARAHGLSPAPTTEDPTNG